MTALFICWQSACCETRLNPCLKSRPVGHVCTVSVNHSKVSTSVTWISVFNSIPDIKAPAANRPEQVVYTLGTGIVGLLLQTRATVSVMGTVWHLLLMLCHLSYNIIKRAYKCDRTVAQLWLSVQLEKSYSELYMNTVSIAIIWQLYPSFVADACISHLRLAAGVPSLNLDQLVMTGFWHSWGPPYELWRVVSNLDHKAAQLGIQGNEKLFISLYDEL